MEIKTCPFCEKTPVIDASKTIEEVAVYRVTHYCTQMKTHIATPWYKTQEEAVKVWNFRI